jgi:hypothetical protein
MGKDKDDQINMAAKPKLSKTSLADDRMPMLSNPAGIATWKKEMSRSQPGC